MEYLHAEEARANDMLATIDSHVEWRKQRWYQGRAVMAKKLAKELGHAPDRPVVGTAGQVEDDETFMENDPQAP